jgi:hypothetical protein
LWGGARTSGSVFGLAVMSVDFGSTLRGLRVAKRSALDMLDTC